MSRVVKGLALLAVLPFGLGIAEVAHAPERSEVVFAFEDPEIIESSGLVARDGLFATVNDSGDSGRVFTVDPATGETVGETTWDDEPYDIEALAPAGPGEVLVGDIGDNINQRDELTLTRVPIGEGDLSGPLATYTLTYPDGPHDAEAMLVHPRTGRVIVVAKEFIGRVYAAPARLAEDRANRLEEIGEAMPIATDGAFFPDGRHLVLRGYSSATVYRWPSLEEVGDLDLPSQQQGEGIAVDEDGRVYVSSEGQHSEVLEVRLPRRIVAEMEGPAPAADPGPAEPEQPAGQDVAAQGERPVWPWLLGGVAGAAIVVVLLRSLRPR